MPSFAFDNLIPDAFAGKIQQGDVFYVMLTTVAYAPSQGGHSKRSQVTNEVVGAGYTAGGIPVVPVFTLDPVSHKFQIAFPPVVWQNSTITAHRAVYYKARGGPASQDELVGVDDFGADLTTANNSFNVGATTFNMMTPVP